MQADPFSFIRSRVLVHFPAWKEAIVSTFGSGLINQTFLVTSGGTAAILQRLAPIFSPLINENIAAVTAALAGAGLATPRLIPAGDGRLWVDLADDGVWRMQTFITGTSFDKVQSPAQAQAAGALVAKFHTAVENLQHTFRGLREGVHATPKHMARLQEALTVHAHHRLYESVAPVAADILERAQTLTPLPALPPRLCHGDLKLNNILFAGETPADSERALCLIDLDTVGPMALAYELGDAWRSWCNRSGEDATAARVDLDVFRASYAAYAGAIGQALTLDQRHALLGGVEWISLELASRFVADALFESYFGWDPQRFGSRGEHNLLRGRGQLALHEAFVATRSERAIILGI